MTALHDISEMLVPIGHKLHQIARVNPEVAPKVFDVVEHLLYVRAEIAKKIADHIAEKLNEV